MCRDADGRLAIEFLEITLAAQTAALAERLKGQSLDLLFLNPGILLGRGVALSNVTDSDIQSIFLTNTISPIRVADTLAHLVAPGGTIAFMSSDMGSVGTNDDGRVELYRASKAALNSLIRSFRARHGKDDLTVLALHPGVVRTSMGGPGAPLDIDTSVRGLMNVIEARWGSGGPAFVDYRCRARNLAAITPLHRPSRPRPIKRGATPIVRIRYRRPADQCSRPATSE